MNRSRLFTILMLTGVILILETGAWATMRLLKPDYLKIKRILTGQKPFVGLQNMISQPYLLYSPSPLLHKWGYLQHNRLGFRGDSVNLEKPAGTYRILFMGGSTTYSNAVANPDSAYPAVVVSYLNTLIDRGQLAIKGIDRFDGINAGLPWGTSIEIMIHYLLKYHYFKPDMIIINTGGNDAYAHFLGAAYQPDYAHFRKSMTDIKPLRYPFRILMYSNVFSLFTIAMFYDQFTKGGQFVHDGDEMLIRWFQSDYRNRNPLRELQWNSFYNNLRVTIQTMKQDGAEVVLMPFLGNWEHPQYTDTILQVHHYYRHLVRQLADTLHVHYLPFDLDVISRKSYWVDDCHLNREGTREKAVYVAGYIRSLLSQKHENAQPDE